MYVKLKTNNAIYDENKVRVASTSNPCVSNVKPTQNKTGMIILQKKKYNMRKKSMKIIMSLLRNDGAQK